MSEVYVALSLFWALVFAGLGGFFLVAGGRFMGRGYRLLAATMGCSAAAELQNGFMSALGPGALSVIAGRASLIFGLIAGAANVHFLLLYCKQKSWLGLAWGAYVLALGAALASVVSTLTQLSSGVGLLFPTEYQSPSRAFSWFVAAVLAAYHVLYLLVAVRATRDKQRGAGAILVAVVLLSPLSLVDISTAYLQGHKWFLAEAGTWIYALVVLSSLLSEVEGTEGLLQETTSSLAERTAELEISYAEIDLMQTELTRKQQLAAVGELAASIAHEVRNPLAIIMNAVSGMRRATISQKDQETLLSIVNEEAERLNHLVAELLRFARPVTASRGPASLFDICQQASQTPPEGYQVAVMTEEGSQLGPVLVDLGLFRLALDNLIANSTQAMPNGGTIELSVRRGKFADGTPAAVVDVADRGCGMKSQDLERARKPFFTTKPRGTGLGIPIADRIVEAHGGEMEIRSEVGQGTTVSIKLPIEKEQVKKSVYPGSKHPSARRRRRSLPATLSGIGPDQEEVS